MEWRAERRRLFFRGGLERMEVWSNWVKGSAKDPIVYLCYAVLLLVLMVV